MERNEMIAKIEKYKMAHGYYDTAKMREEIAGMSGIAATLDCFWGSTDVGTKTADVHPEIALAEELNAELEAVEIERERTETQAAFTRATNGTGSKADWRLLVKRGLAVDLYEDPESNAPTATRIRDHRDIDGNIYTDQAGIEEKPGRL